MKKLDINGRIGIPKEIRERNGFKTDDAFEVFERGNDIIFRPLKSDYKVTENEMYIVRKLYNMIKDTDILEDSELNILKEICGITDVKCPKCGENLYLTSDNSYKCMKCGE